MLCKLVIGNRGSGKSVGNEVELLQLALERRCAVLFLDRPGTSARALVGHLAARGRDSCVLFEEAARTDRVLAWPFLQPSSAPGPLDRQRENDLIDERFAQAFYAKRGLKDGEQKPYTKKYLDAAIAVWRSQPAPTPLSALLDVFRPGTRAHDELLARAADQESVSVFRDVERRCSRSPVQYEMETGAAQRLLAIAGSPVLGTRHGGSFDWTEALRQKTQIYVDLSRVSTEAARALAIFAYTAALNTCKQHHETTGQPLDFLVVLEEAGALDLVTPTLLMAMKEDRKAGSAAWLISQTLQDFGDEGTVEELLALCDVHYWYRMNAGVERAARDLANPTFDPLLPHFTRTRLQIGSYKEVLTHGRGISRDGLTGRIVRKDERSGIAFRPVFERVTDVYYKTPELHAQEFRTKLSNLKVGHRLVRDLEGVREEHVKLLPEPWALGLTGKRTQEAIERIRRRAVYQSVPQHSPEQGREPHATAAERLRSIGSTTSPRLADS